MYTFIVRPFGVKQGIDFDAVDKELIQPALRAVGIIGETTVAIAEAGNIREDMFAKLLTADLVIADISVHNANVFYELGIRHALRDRKTLLLRCSADSILDVPFDLKTDRYLTYAIPTLKVDSLRLKQALLETIHSDRKDSPVFSLLPHLKAQDPERFVVAPAGFCKQVEEAQINRQEGKLALLAAETGGFPWELSGLRLVGGIQFDMESLTGARFTWERIRTILPDDEEANDRLSTIYQRLSEQYATHSTELNSPALTLLSLSDQAINTLLARPLELSAGKRAEIYSLKGRNAKLRWMNEWQFAHPEEFRQKAIESSFLLRAYEAYAQAFMEDLNHYYAGINALSLLTIILNLTEAYPSLWEEHFDDAQEAEIMLQTLQRKYTDYTTVVSISLESAKHRKYSHGEINSLLDVNLADFRCLTLDKPRRILRLYQDAISAGEPVLADYTRRQLELYQKLQIRTDVVDPVLDQLAPVTSPTVALKPHFVVFTGHTIDRPGHPVRFPCGQDEKAKDEIRKKLNTIRKHIKRPIIGIAGGACGGDILFHEVCEEPEIAIPTRMFLAVPKQQYIKESVAYAGQRWIERFEHLYRSHSQPDDYRLRIMSDTKKLPFWLQRKKNYNLWERTNLWMLYHALIYGEGETSLIALWDGKGGSGQGSTQDLVRRMDEHGFENVIINTTDLFNL
ncbi:tetratricopeptide repeat-containing protein [Spirosoma validum]|uniref:DUF4071 domain-containing protein n=1 Tax=Spirosoma validum TaxID=2771355 RepID=A0A927B6M9_9BACT|nr:tetratricopeptide repeat-containing protein [Spirosoma validum]MBD2756694.1 hypothetical protein [Spirosoma validum]